jgi:hypothetical protein
VPQTLTEEDREALSSFLFSPAAGGVNCELLEAGTETEYDDALSSPPLLLSLSAGLFSRVPGVLLLPVTIMNLSKPRGHKT